MHTNQKLKINIGPQHPSTHGVLRLVLELDGETIKSCEPVVGYLHRGMEKMAENRIFLQYLPTVDRIDYLGGFFNSYAYCAAVEKLSGMDVSKRTGCIRVLTMELNRLSSHLLWLGTFLLDLGATSPLFYSFRDREIILSFFEKLTGQRMMYNYYTFGGVRHDVDNNWLSEVEAFVKSMPQKIKDYEHIITDNPIFTSRTKNLGVITKRMASEYSITGPNLRASGVDCDCRKDPIAKEYSNLYKELDFDIIIKNNGDSYDRYTARIDEMKECLKIVEQCCQWLKSNPGNVITSSKLPTLKVPEGECISYVEAPRGLCSCYLKTDGGTMPYRLKWRTGSFYAVQLLPKLLEGAQYPDLMAIFGSLDVILPEVDR